jgi:hypothetical protein
MKRRGFLRGIGAAGGLALTSHLSRSAAAGRIAALDRLAQATIAVTARVAAPGATPSDGPDLVLPHGLQARRGLRAGNLALRAASVTAAPDAVDLAATFRARAGAPGECLALTLELGAWSRDSYLLLPGACYAGNRFESRFVVYPPLLTEPADIGPHVPPIVTDIPRLNVHTGPSRLEILAADLATPAAAIFLPAARLGLVMLVDPTTSVGRTGLTVSESDDRASARVTVSTPFSYQGKRLPGGAPPARPEPAPAPGDRAPITLRARVFVFDCVDVSQLCERLFAVRRSLTGPSLRAHTLPFSAAFAAHEARVNRRWVETPGYFAAGDRDSAYSTWQTGWCGGLAATLPLLAAGAELSRARALRTIAFALDGGQAPSGFFHGLSDGKRWYDDGFTASLPPPVGGWPPRAPAYPHARRWHLVRRSADTLTVLVKQLALLDRQQAAGAGPVGPAIDPRWARAARLCADALCGLWRRNRQLGQFVDIETGELVVGGSTSAGLAPAGLALAAGYLKEPRYLEVAKAVAAYYADRYIQIGLTCGGPGDALQCPDSESAAALLESFVTLYEATRDRVWIDRARAAAHLLASWVISYDGTPAGPGCAAADGTRAPGAVLSNAQSRGGLPGYVLLSGDALFRLYRATGEVAWLELLGDTVHNLAQYLRRPTLADPDAAFSSSAAPPERDCARVDTGAWLETQSAVVPLASLFDAIGLLSYTEVPGIYAQIDRGFVFAFDHVDVRLKERLAGGLVLALHNPTPIEAKVRLFAETAADAAEPLPPGAILSAPTTVVPPRGTVEVAVPPLAASR